MLDTCTVATDTIVCVVTDSERLTSTSTTRERQPSLNPADGDERQHSPTREHNDNGSSLVGAAD
jgi:hypothetical protein